MNHTHIHTLRVRHTPLFSQSAYTNSKPQITWNNAFAVSNQNIKSTTIVLKSEVLTGNLKVLLKSEVLTGNFQCFTVRSALLGVDGG